MVKKKVIIKNPNGLHLFPASLFCEEALKFDSHISFQYQNKYVNGKSLLSVLAAGVKENSEIELICEGKDEAEAIGHLSDLLECS